MTGKTRSKTAKRTRGEVLGTEPAGPLVPNDDRSADQGLLIETGPGGIKKRRLAVERGPEKTTEEEVAGTEPAGPLVLSGNRIEDQGLLIETDHDGIKRRRLAEERGRMEATPSSSSISPQTESTTSSSVMVPFDAVAHLLSQLRDEDRSLPTFSGEVLDWPGFIEKYRRTTKAGNISDDVNRKRLEDALKGPARRLVQDKINHTCFLQEIIDQLEAEYGGRDTMVKAAVAQVTQVRRLDSKLERIGEFVNEALRIRKMIRYCGDLSLDLPLLLIMTEHLPTIARMRWGDYQREMGKPGQGTFHDFVECMKRIEKECGHDHVRRRDSLQPREQEPRDRDDRGYKPATTYRRQAPEKTERRQRERSPLRLLYTSQPRESHRRPDTNNAEIARKENNTNRPGDTDKRCELGCKFGHSWLECPVFNEAKQPERFVLLRKHGRCLYCSGKHIVRNCDKISKA